MNFFDFIFTSLFITAIFAAGIVIGALGVKNKVVVQMFKDRYGSRGN